MRPVLNLPNLLSLSRVAAVFVLAALVAVALFLVMRG